MTTKTNTAQTYADIIAEELKNLEKAACAPYGFNPNDSTTDDKDATEYREALTNLEMAHDTEDALNLWINETALDLAILRDTRGNEYAQRIEILRTCGGPTCYITRDSNDGSRIEVRVSDGYEQHSQSVWLDVVAEYLDQIGDNQ